MSSLLHTAINNRQAAAHPRDSPGKKLAKLSLASDEDTDEADGDFPETYDDEDEDEDDDEMVDLQTTPGTPVPGGVKSVGLSSGTGLRSLSGKLTTSRDPVSRHYPRPPFVSHERPKVTNPPLGAGSPCLSPTRHQIPRTLQPRLQTMAQIIHPKLQYALPSLLPSSHTNPPPQSLVPALSLPHPPETNHDPPKTPPDRTGPRRSKLRLRPLRQVPRPPPTRHPGPRLIHPTME